MGISIRFIDYLDRVRSTYWFLPLIMTAASMILAVLLLEVDRMTPDSLLEGKWYILNVDSSDINSILLNIAGAALGVIGVVFSITLVPLTIAASQYGPILIRSFLRDTTTQVVLGTYSSTIGFCVMVLMSYESGTDSGGVPLISVTFAVLMLLVSLAMLLYFFHHVAEGLQASKIIENVGNEVEKEIRFERWSSGPAEGRGGPGEEDKLRSVTMQQGKAVVANKSGYVRAIDYGQLLKTAEKNDLVFYLKHISGDFIVPGDQLLLAWPGSFEVIKLAAAVNASYILGDNRTMQQDIEYGMTSLVIIASRALSPAINDPVTPAMCLNRLGVALSMLADSKPRSSYYYDKSGKLRVIADPVSFERMAGTSFDLIRQYGRGNADVMIAILKTINSVAAHASSDEKRAILFRHAQLALSDSDTSLPSPYDRKRVHQAYDEVRKSIEGTGIN
ncbi:MAG: DUF2254 domain-containing protein [Methanotrichaceae archaeon]|nr:DUF2254 domain-containing protein [Methanotrichaceae archaeon]